MKTVTSSLRSSESAFSGLGISLGSVALGNVLSAVVALVICIILAKVIISLLGKILEKSKLDKTMHAFIKSAAKVILTVLSAIIVFGSLGFETSSLVALLSVAGLAISLALQNSLSNLAGGVMLLVTKPVEVGDFVEVGGITGTILEIGLTYTKLNTLDNKRVSIPNSTISSANIINYSTEGKRRVDFLFTASYDSPVEDVKKAIREAIEKTENVLMDEDIFIHVSNYASNSIEYTVRVWCKTPDYWSVYFGIMENMQQAYNDHGVSVTYDHLNVHMIQDK